MVAAAVVVLIAAISLTVALGDRVGVTIERVAPLGEGHSTSPILISFSEAMDRPTVEERLRTEPALEGEYSWTGQSVTFKPSTALLPGSAFTVVMEAGARSESGRELLSEYRYDFTVAPLRIAYLYPSDGQPQNIWMVDPRDPENPTQVTNSPSGIFDFSVSPDGSRIAFSEANSLENTYDIKLIELASGALRQLTNCIDASCTNPVWNPNGRQIAYERIEYNTEFTDVGTSPTRVWLLDLDTSPATTRPLFNESQILGYSPQWSADGTRIALYDRGTIATLVHDLSDGSITSVPNASGTIGALSPDGTKLAYTEIILIDGGGSRSTLQIANLETGSLTQITTADDLISDQRALWSPDGKTLAVARQNPNVMRSTQITFIDPETGDATPFTNDPRYANAFFWYDPTGTQILVQRFPELDENMQPNTMGRPEIWTFDIATGEGVMIANNAYIPRWVP